MYIYIFVADLQCGCTLSEVPLPGKHFLVNRTECSPKIRLDVCWKFWSKNHVLVITMHTLHGDLTETSAYFQPLLAVWKVCLGCAYEPLIITSTCGTVILFSRLNYFFWDTLILWISFSRVDIYNFRGNLSDTLCKPKKLMQAWDRLGHRRAV